VQGFVYGDQLNPVAELDGSGNVTARFVYGTKSNVPDPMVKGGVTYRYVTDQLGSVRLVVDASTGAIAQRIDYDEYGVVIQYTNPGFQPFGFAGGIADSHTGLVRFGARDYDPQTGRWTSKDPIAFAGHDPDLFRYGSDDPVDLLDSEGRFNRRCAEHLARWALRRARTVAAQPGFPGGTAGLHNGPADAFRHCYWSCLMVRRCGKATAFLAGWGHELFQNRFWEAPDEFYMDTANNSAGRSCGDRGCSCETCCRGRLACGRLKTHPFSPTVGPVGHHPVTGPTYPY